MRGLRAAGVLLALATLLAPVATHAADPWPNRPLRMVRLQRRRPYDPDLAWLRWAWASLAVRCLGLVVVVLVLVVAR